MKHDDFIKHMDMKFKRMHDNVTKVVNQQTFTERFNIADEENEVFTEENFNGKADNNFKEVDKNKDLQEKSENKSFIDENFNVFPQKGVSNFSVANLSLSDDGTFNGKRLPTAAEKKVFCDSLRTDLPSRRVCIL